MYYIAETYYDWESKEVNVIEFSENKIFLEEKVEKLNRIIEEQKEIFDQVRELTDNFNDTVSKIQYSLKILKEKAFEKVKSIVDIPAQLESYLCFVDNTLRSNEISSDFPEYSVKETKDADF